MHTLLYIKGDRGERESNEKRNETGGIGRQTRRDRQTKPAGSTDKIGGIGRPGTAGKRLTNGLDRIGKTVRLVIAEVVREV